jgi:hypothetical protein
MSSDTVISHSEVDTFLLCEKRHYYAFGDSTYGDKKGLEPLNVSDALYRGISGHTALHAYYQKLIDGGTIEQAEQSSLMANSALALRPRANLSILTDLNARILPRFYAVAGEKIRSGWRPLAAEKEFRLHLVNEEGIHLVYPFRPDLIIADPAGNIWVWDHKFVYNFYTQEEINLLPQIPKYVGALRALGHEIKGGYYNQLRHREVKDLANHVQQVPFVPSNERVVESFRQQANLMGKIGNLKQLPGDEWSQRSTRTLNTMVCKTCSFKHLCAVELNGGNGKLMRQAEFQANTYGYKEEADI